MTSLGFQAALTALTAAWSNTDLACLDRTTRRAHTLSQLLEDGYSVRATDMPGAGDLKMRVYAAMAQKERELISERTRTALAGARCVGRCWAEIGAARRPRRRMRRRRLSVQKELTRLPINSR